MRKSSSVNYSTHCDCYVVEMNETIYHNEQVIWKALIYFDGTGWNIREQRSVTDFTPAYRI